MAEDYVKNFILGARTGESPPSAKRQRTDPGEKGIRALFIPTLPSPRQDRQIGKFKFSYLDYPTRFKVTEYENVQPPEPWAECYDANDFNGRIKRILKDNARSVASKAIRAFVFSNNTWKTLYGCKLRELITIGQVVPQGPTPFPETVPCHNCGFCCPIQIIEIDHYVPSDINNPHMHVVFKVLRAHGYTKEAPSGKKGTRFYKPNVTFIPPRGGVMGAWSFRDASPNRRRKFELNDKGIIAYNIVRGESGGTAADVHRLLNNNVINLLPLCTACNKSKKNKIKEVE